MPKDTLTVIIAMLQLIGYLEHLQATKLMSDAYGDELPLTKKTTLYTPPVGQK